MTPATKVTARRVALGTGLFPRSQTEGQKLVLPCLSLLLPLCKSLGGGLVKTASAAFFWREGQTSVAGRRNEEGKGRILNTSDKRDDSKS